MDFVDVGVSFVPRFTFILTPLLPSPLWLSFIVIFAGPTATDNPESISAFRDRGGKVIMYECHQPHTHRALACLVWLLWVSRSLGLVVWLLSLRFILR